MALIYGQLEKAQLENLSSNPTPASAGRVWWNSTTKHVFVDDTSIARVLGALAIGSNEAIASGGTITNSADFMQLRRVSSNGGAVNLSTTPFATFSNIAEGSIVVLQGTSATDIPTLVHNDASGGCLLNGNAALGLDNVIGLLKHNDRMREIFRNF
jgi:hypothetical protein